jgi:1,4-alpha-glucan branching enzyme
VDSEKEIGMTRNNGHPGQMTRRRVCFKLKAPEAREVVLFGTFNNWESGFRTLKRTETGVWRTYLMLEPGIYEYRFRVDGEWRNDPEAETVPNLFGDENCLQVVL